MEATLDVEILCKLGEGAYGAVHKAKVISSGQIVAIKTIRVVDQDEGISSTTLRQITILQSLDHPNIIKQADKNHRMLKSRMEITSLDPRIEIYFEYMDEDLGKLLKRKKVLDRQLVKNIMRQILQAVSYMHSKRVFHRDLKPQNILIDHQGKIKIADFGLGRIVNFQLETMSKEIETLWYRAPELLFGTTRYDLGVDIWSIGCIFYELSQGSVLFQTESEIGQIFEIMRQQGTPKMSEWQNITQLPFFKASFPKFVKSERVYNYLCAEGIDLLQKMIIVNPSKRIAVNQAVNHPYLKNS